MVQAATPHRSRAITTHYEIGGIHLIACNDQTRLLRVRIIRALDLMKKDIFGASDPYCKIFLYKNLRSSTLLCPPVQTKTIKRSLNPIWNEEVIFRVNPLENRLVFELYDENRLTRDDFLGVVTVSLPHLEIGTEGSGQRLVPKSFMLHPRSSRSRVRGNLHLYLVYLSQEINPRALTVNDLRHPAATNELPSPAASERPSSPIPDSNTSTRDAVGGGELDDTPVEEQDQDQVTATLPDGSPHRNDVTNSTTAACNTVSLDDASVELVADPLPPGWDERVDQNGRTYYVDHVNRRTQWDRPSSQLPEGWEQRTDANGRVYYVDHINHQTTWYHPLSTSSSHAVLTPSRSPVENGSGSDAGSQSSGDEAVHEETEPNGNAEQSPTNSPNAENPCGSSTTTPTVTDRRESSRRTNASGRRALAVSPSASGTSSRSRARPGGTRSSIPHSNSTEQNVLDEVRAAQTMYLRRRQVSLEDTLSHSANGLELFNRLRLPGTTPLPPGWEERMHTNGRIFFIDHNTRTTQWEDPRLERLGGPAVPYSRNYKHKYDYFRSRLRAPHDSQAKLELRVTRAGIFEDSFRQIYGIKKTECLMHRLWIEFLGEKGLDYGGVQREWFFLLSREMFNPYYGLFEYSAADNYTLQINPLSGVANEDHLKYFKFIGRVVGMAVYHGKLIDGFFIRPFYKMMLEKTITLKDMESVDSEYYRSLKYILEEDPSELDLTFSVDEEHFGETVEVDLIPNGRRIPVTNANKKQYIECIIGWRFVSRVKPQMWAFLDGFKDVIDLETIKIFDANELELLICGLQGISVSDWKSHTLYKGEYHPNHPVIVNFWKAVYTFTNELRSRLLQFVTGTSRVPMNGFAELWGSSGPQKFTIECWGNVDQLPRAHTCFNRLDLPCYPTFEELRTKLIIAIENAEGFEGVD
ncbi:unnamed protein product [Dicrocoelium dendriticum]|nr:unnamed protein product [Dicrocoelium dendriticum]